MSRQKDHGPLKSEKRLDFDNQRCFHPQLSEVTTIQHNSIPTLSFSTGLPKPSSHPSKIACVSSSILYDPGRGYHTVSTFIGVSKRGVPEKWEFQNTGYGTCKVGEVYDIQKEAYIPTFAMAMAVLHTFVISKRLCKQSTMHFTFQRPFPTHTTHTSQRSHMPPSPKTKPLQSHAPPQKSHHQNPPPIPNPRKKKQKNP